MFVMVWFFSFFKCHTDGSCDINELVPFSELCCKISFEEP